jgi:urease accessory protein
VIQLVAESEKGIISTACDNQRLFVVSTVAGNIHSNRRIAEKWRRAELSGAAEHLLVSRTEMDKVRMRRKTDRGTDVGIILERGSRLHHGDVLGMKEKLIVVVQMPERVISVIMNKRSVGQLVKTAVAVGHAIGNRHKPIAVSQGKIDFPIQNESEMEIFAKLMPPGVKLTVTTKIFVPTGEVHQHE